MFTPLSEKEIEEIVSLQIDNIKKMLEKNGVTLEITPKALGLIAAEGYDPEFGARIPVKRVDTPAYLEPVVERSAGPESRPIEAYHSRYRK